MTRKTTLTDVARAAGVSVATVDRVLNNRGGVKPDKEVAILDAARRLMLDRNLDSRPTRLINVCVLMSPPSNPFFERLRWAFRRANQIHRAANIRCFVRHVDILKVRESAQIVRRETDRHDAIIAVFPNDPVVVDALCEAARKRPLITLVSDLPDVPRLAFVGIDNRAAGRVAGELVGRFMGGAGGDVAVFNGLHSYIAHEEREMGFRAVLRERFPACRLVSVIETQEKGDLAGPLIADLIHQHPDVGGIYNVSSGNRAIAKVLRQFDLHEKVVLVTHELTDERRSLLKAGVIDALIDQNPEQQAMRAVETLAHHFGRLDLPETSGPTPASIILRENVDNAPQERS